MKEFPLSLSFLVSTIPLKAKHVHLKHKEVCYIIFQSTVSAYAARLFVTREPASATAARVNNNISQYRNTEIVFSYSLERFIRGFIWSVYHKDFFFNVYQMTPQLC